MQAAGLTKGNYYGRITRKICYSKRSSHCVYDFSELVTLYSSKRLFTCASLLTGGTSEPEEGMGRHSPVVASKRSKVVEGSGVGVEWGVPVLLQCHVTSLLVAVGVSRGGVLVAWI
jgi:hypothetical protein